MKNLPEGMVSDRDNQVYFDTEKNLLYMIKWEETGNNDIPHRIYLPKGVTMSLLCKLFGHKWEKFIQQIPVDYGHTKKYKFCIRCGKENPNYD